MSVSCLDRVNSAELERQRALTQALWSRLEEQGLKDGTPGHIECCFLAPSDAEVARLTPGFPDWECTVAENDHPKWSRLVRIASPQVHLTRDAFMHLLEVSMVAGADSACVFDGFQVDTTALKKGKRWWPF